jgi:cation diffusion facilitator family transporter
VSVQAQAKVASVKRTLIGVLVLNLLVAAAKLVVGGLIQSISMVADGFHSLTDSASNVVGLIGIAWAAAPPDEDHPYGHWKYETFAALLIGGLLAMTAWEILRSCLARLTGGGSPTVEPVAFVVMGATMLVNIGVATYEHRKGLELGSDLLRADAAHTRSDVFVSMAVIASLIAARYGYPELDLVAALVITFMIARAALEILRRSAKRLTDVAAVPSERVRQVALTVPGVISVHKIRSRSGPAGAHADLHVQVAPDLRLDEAHEIGHRVVDRLSEELGLEDVVTHVEPPNGRDRGATPG